MKNRITKPWQAILMHDATGVDTDDPMLVVNVNEYLSHFC